ncbi:hypothetical protein U0035_01375 [Niabella yanshanensis]|uniref:Uncharacterized protein n=1 Tax=Niabella yanshanensis TaxID=577386 RepID=A0ABZ0W667_9BACT|nr:hypothetical protein [Niabella yanshanensis]WQD38793.1 hypothetical protein U0035_01375 [Niabella yanshanensis]
MWQILKKPVLYNNVWIKKATGILFLVVLLFSYSVQALHHHSEASRNNTTGYKISFVKGDSNRHCDICDQIEHQPTFDLAFNASLICSLSPGDSVHGGRYRIGFNTSILQGFSNKGPPFTLTS